MVFLQLVGIAIGIVYGKPYYRKCGRAKLYLRQRQRASLFQVLVQEVFLILYGLIIALLIPKEIFEVPV
jgi:hypothetical protein